MAKPDSHPLAGLDEAVERIRASALIDKPQAAEVAFAALRAVLATVLREQAELRAALDEHKRRGH